MRTYRERPRERCRVDHCLGLNTPPTLTKTDVRTLAVLFTVHGQDEACVRCIEGVLVVSRKKILKCAENHKTKGMFSPCNIKRTTRTSAEARCMPVDWAMYLWPSTSTLADGKAVGQNRRDEREKSWSDARSSSRWAPHLLRTKLHGRTASHPLLRRVIASRRRKRVLCR